MAKGYIDSAMVYEIIVVFDARQLEDTYPWAWESAVAVTTALINAPQLSLSPSPGVDRDGGGLYSQLMHHLQPYIASEPNRQIKQLALRNTRCWARSNPTKIYDAYSHLKLDHHNFQRWLDWAITNAWEENILRLGGLFNSEFINEMATILGMSETELCEIQRIGQNMTTVTDLIKRRPESDEFALLIDAYMISALLRGRYHDNVAKSGNHQILHHQIRYQILPSTPSSRENRFDISAVEQHLSSIVLASAFHEANSRSRIESWAENIRRLKSVYPSGYIEKAKYADHGPVEAAIAVAKDIGIRTQSEWVYRYVDGLINIGIFAPLTSFVLNPFEALVTTAALWGFSDSMKTGIRNSLDTRGRLRYLAQYPAGRIMLEHRTPQGQPK